MKNAFGRLLLVLFTKNARNILKLKEKKNLRFASLLDGTQNGTKNFRNFCVRK